MPKIACKYLLRLFLGLTLAFILSGCLKIRMTIDVKPSGSGNLGVAIGMTEEAKALIASQGEDPLQTLSESLGVSSDSSSDVKVTRWIEGDYEWVQGEIAFQDLNELNTVMSQTGLFESFSLTRQPGIFRDRFILDARLKPFVQDTMTGDTSDFGDIDPSAFIEFQVAMHLPGNIIETNGILDGQQSSNMLWTVSSKQSTTMQATTETWNWLNIGIAGGGICLAAIAVAGLILFVIVFGLRHRTRRKNG